ELQMCFSHLVFLLAFLFIWAANRTFLIVLYVIFISVKLPYVTLHMLNAMTSVMIVQVGVWVHTQKIKLA
ncbi:MAG: hypothetical protein KGJ13_12985, partial [Patescibacteria group bacterium]|nr:hypothetical protein [Patescibacteria group bacterium]